MCRPTWYALALFACIVLLPAASPGAMLPIQVRACGTVTRLLPDGFTIALDRARTGHPVETFHDSQNVPIVVNEKARLSFSNNMRATLAPGLEAQNITIIGRITSQGVARTRSASFVLVR
jgi:hypothetical protein